jgi:5-methylcytosine-specific restriction endonuclease McrA
MTSAGHFGPHRAGCRASWPTGAVRDDTWEVITVAVLLLNASFEPIAVVPVIRAVGLVLGGRAEVVAAGSGELRSASASMPIPAVARLLKMVSIPHRHAVPLTRGALEVRDGGTCQVSGCSRKGDTVDHVIPRSKGGTHSWGNVVLMCHRHNNTKGDLSLEQLGWTLTRRPRPPRAEVAVLASARVRNVPETWEPFLEYASAGR